MAPSARGQKRDRERARAEKAVAKRERKELRQADAGSDVDPVDADYQEAEILAQLADLHQRFADERISHEDFESQRDLLMSRLRIN